jgi:hypothetical protein
MAVFKCWCEMENNPSRQISNSRIDSKKGENSILGISASEMREREKA